MSDNKARHKRGRFSEALASHSYLIVGGLVATIIAGAIAVIAYIFPREAPGAPTEVAGDPTEVASNPAELSVDFGPHKAEVTSFIVPADAPFESFPFGISPGCTTEQIRWLNQHGVERRTSWTVRFRSTAAGEGNMITLENLRLSGDVGESAEPGSVFVDCPDAGLPEVAFVRAEIGSDVDPVMSTAADSTPRPFMYNLEPGEAGLVLLSLLGDKGFSGDVTVDIASGDVVLPQALNESPLELPAISGIELELIVGEGNDGLFTCTHPFDESAPFWPCTPDDVRAFMTDRCSEPRLRGALQAGERPLSESGDSGEYFYDSWTVHGCSDGFALVEGSHSAGSSFDFWVLRFDENDWSIVLVGSTRPGTPASQALFDGDELDAALDGEVDAFLMAVGATTQNGRAVAG